MSDPKRSLPSVKKVKPRCNHESVGLKQQAEPHTCEQRGTCERHNRCREDFVRTVISDLTGDVVCQDVEERLTRHYYHGAVYMERGVEDVRPPRSSYSHLRLQIHCRQRKR